MNLLELKKEIDDLIEAGADKYGTVYVEDTEWGERRYPLNVVSFEYREWTNDVGTPIGGYVIR